MEGERREAVEGGREAEAKPEVRRIPSRSQLGSTNS